MANELDASSDFEEYSIDRYDEIKAYEFLQKPSFKYIFDYHITSLSVRDSNSKVICKIQFGLRKKGATRERVWIADEEGLPLAKFATHGFWSGKIISETKVLKPNGQLLATVILRDLDSNKGPRTGSIASSLFCDFTNKAERYMEDPFGRRLAATRVCPIEMVIPNYRVFDPNGDVIATFREGPSKETARVLINKKKIDPLLLICFISVFKVPQYPNGWLSEEQIERYSRWLKN